MSVFVEKEKSSYFSKLKQEMKNVSWTSRKKLLKRTKIVLISIFLAGMGIYFLDVIIHTLLKIFGYFIKLIIG